MIKGGGLHRGSQAGKEYGEMCLMEGKLEKLNGNFQHAVQKTVLSKQQEDPAFVPTHVCVSLAEAATLPAFVEVLLANRHKTVLPVFGWKEAREGCLCIQRPEVEESL